MGNIIQMIMNLFFGGNQKKEVKELWEIAHKYEPKGLRDNYISGNIFNLGDIIENLNTGLIGEIVRR